MNVQAEIIYLQPKTEDERAEIAQACMLDTGLELPMLLDDMTNQVDGKYIALPERLYVIDAEGRVAFRCGMGPFGFDPDGWEQAIREVIA
jgi:hypothetical protein